MNIRTNFKHTIFACYLGYITQAIINNFVPLLFIIFHNSYEISLDKIGGLVTLNFTVQLIVDLISANFADKIGYRKTIVFAHILSSIGLICLGILPDVFSNSYIGICISIIIYAIGGGLIEVLISPIIEACPTQNKASQMSLLHSFYCWGSVITVLLSTVMFESIGITLWQKVTRIWAMIPLFNALYFTQVPIRTLNENSESMSVSDVIKSKVFWVFALLMFCAGASELSMSQWASAFAEMGLKVSKTMGDLLGPCLFAVLMGFARVLHSRIAHKVSITKYLTVCATICVFSYILSSLSPFPIISLISCGICGFSVGAMWPGTFSLASEKCKSGGTALFALLALAGDCGCGLGPSAVGFISELTNNNLNIGLFFAVIFPVLMIIGLYFANKITKRQ